MAGLRVLLALLALAAPARAEHDPRIVVAGDADAWWLGGRPVGNAEGPARQTCQARIRRSGGEQRAEALKPVFKAAATYYQLPPAYVQAVTAIESHYDPMAVSRRCARGLMQLMPATAKSMGVKDAHDPVQNVWGGARFLRLLANRFKGDLTLTTAAYNAGPGAVEKYDGVPPYAETQRYVGRVLGRYKELTQRSEDKP